MPEIIKNIRNTMKQKTENIQIDQNVIEKYEHIRRRKTQWELLRLSSTVMGVEVAYSALTAFVSPIMLQTGIGHEQMSLVWAISPAIGLILSPIIGSVSDRCKLHWGRRRPFILMLAILEIIGLVLISNGKVMGNVLGPTFENGVAWIKRQTVSNDTNLAEYNGQKDFTFTIHIWTVAITIFGIVIADFSADALQNPSRAYLLDVCNTEDHARGLSTCAILAGCGGFLGYLLGSVDWNNNTIGKFMGGHIRSLYSFIIIILTASVTIAITTFKEMPLHIVRSDTKEITTEPRLSDYLKSIVVMPYSMKMLYLTNLLCWISHVNFALYFTHFVGEAVFQGNPSAGTETDAYQLYESGVRFACIGMSLYSVFCICYSIYIEKLIKMFGLRYIYIGIIMLDSISLFCMTTFKNKILVLLLCSVSGIMYCTIVTVPYILVAHYHTKNIFEIDNEGIPIPLKQIRGLGTDISIIGTSVCIAQLLLSVVVGQVISLITSTGMILSTSSFFGFCAVIAASQIMYLDL